MRALILGKGIRSFSLFLLCISFSSGVCFADSAAVLPKGVTRAKLDTFYFLPFDERYDQDGHVEDVATNFNADLNSDVFTALKAFETGLLPPGFNLPPGTKATVGNSIVSFEYSLTKVFLSLDYGVTDRLTAGVLVPYYWVENKVTADLNTSAANIGKNDALSTLAPLTVPGTVPLTKEDVLNLLGPGLQVGGATIPGYGYKMFETWSGDGIGDIRVGFKYQYYNSKDWRLAFSSGVVFPTGEIDDPDNLVDYRPVDGVWAVPFVLNNDYTGIENLVLDATFRYTWMLPDHRTLRVLEDVDQPIATNKENVRLDMGDVVELEGSGSYRFTKTWSASLLYKYGFKLKDRVSGSQGFDYSPLEEETDYTEHVGIVGVSYSTISLFKEKKFSVPLVVELNYRNRFAGSNNLFKTEYLNLGISVFF